MYVRVNMVNILFTAELTKEEKVMCIRVLCSRHGRRQFYFVIAFEAFLTDHGFVRCYFPWPA